LILRPIAVASKLLSVKSKLLLRIQAQPLMDAKQQALCSQPQTSTAEHLNRHPLARHSIAADSHVEATA